MSLPISHTSLRLLYVPSALSSLNHIPKEWHNLILVLQKITGYLPKDDGAKLAFKDADIIVIPAGIPRTFFSRAKEAEEYC